MYHSNTFQDLYPIRPRLPDVFKKEKNSDQFENNGKELSKHMRSVLGSSAGKQLSPDTLNSMNSRFNFDFRNVRVHDDSLAWESAESLNANAFTTGDHIVFNKGLYGNDTFSGRNLLAHELAHVIQNKKDNISSDIEKHADEAALMVSGGKSVYPENLGGSDAKLHRKEKEKGPEKKGTKEEEVKIPAEKLIKIPEKAETEEGEGPEMPSRIPIPGLEKGKFSMGLRLGFPELSLRAPGQLEMPDPLKESLNKAKIMNQFITGKVPSGWEDTDKGKLAKAVWGIFSQNIAPGLARKITSGLSASTAPGGLSYELDLVLITDFSKEIGGGLSFTVRF